MEPGTVLMSRTLNEIHTEVSGPDQNPPTGAKVDTENPDSEANRSTLLNHKEKESGALAQLLGFVVAGGRAVSRGQRDREHEMTDGRS